MNIPNLPMNQTSYVTMAAKEVWNMAHNSIVEIAAIRQEAKREALKHCMAQRCVHRIPILGIPFASHPRYPSVKLAEEYAPEVHFAASVGSGDEETCERLKTLAQWLIDNRDEAHQTMHVTVRDFYAMYPAT